MKRNGILISGCAGNGKTTFKELLTETLMGASPKMKIATADMSNIIKWCKKLPGPIGEAIREQEPMMRAGKLLEDHLTKRAFREWFMTELEGEPDIMIVSGMPRSFEQLSILEHFHQWLVIHIVAERKDSDESIRKRLAKSNGQVREDDLGGEKVMETRWNEFVQVTKPALDSLSGNVLLLDRKMPLRQRLQLTLMDQVGRDDSPVHPDVCLRSLNLLDSGLLRGVESKISLIESHV